MDNMDIVLLFIYISSLAIAKYIFIVLRNVVVHYMQEEKNQKLKVPKCEIFDRSDFHDFYSIKPFWVGDFGAKI